MRGNLRRKREGPGEGKGDLSSNSLVALSVSSSWGRARSCSSGLSVNFPGEQEQKLAHSMKLAHRIKDEGLTVELDFNTQQKE